MVIALLFDKTIHIGDVIVGLVVPVFGWGLRKMYKLGRRFVDEFESHGQGLYEQAEVIDEHSNILQKMGWKPSKLTMLGLVERRRKVRRSADATGTGTGYERIG